MAIDRQTWARASPGSDNYWSFIQDEAVRRYVQRNIEDPGGFEATLAELFFEGALRQAGIPADRVERNAYPDIVVAAGTERETWADVKHLRLGTSEKRAKDVVEKANRQVKVATPSASGLALVRVSRPVERIALNDEVPDDIRARIDLIRHKLVRHRFRSVARVIVTWDDYLLTDGNESKQIYAFRRHAVALDHPAPQSPLRYPVDPAVFERTVVVGNAEGAQFGDVRRSTGGDIVASALFLDQNEDEYRGRVRVDHAIEVLRSPDAFFIAGVDTLRSVWATRLIRAARSPFVLLVLALQRDNEPTSLSMAFRIYDDLGSLEDLAQDPLAAFHLVLFHWGMPLEFNGVTDRLHNWVFLPGQEAFQEHVRHLSRSEPYVVSAIVRAVQAPVVGEAAVGVFGLYRDRYRRYVAGHLS